MCEPTDEGVVELALALCNMLQYDERRRAGVQLDVRLIPVVGAIVLVATQHDELTLKRFTVWLKG